MTRTNSMLRALIPAVSLATTILVHRHAAAEIVLAKQNDWEVSVDGRLNTFVNYSQGDRTPDGVAEWTAGLFEPPDPNSGNIAVVRVRSGFVQNVLGFNLVKEAAPGYRLVGRFALWVGASNERKPVLGQPPERSRPARRTSGSRRRGERYRQGARSGFSAAGASSWMRRSFTRTAWVVRARPAPSWAAPAASPGTAFCFLLSTRVSSTARPRWPGFSSRSGSTIRASTANEATRSRRTPASRRRSRTTCATYSRCSGKPCGSG